MTKYFVNTEESPLITYPFGCWSAFDRTRTIFDCKSIVPIIGIGNKTESRSFSELCDIRAEEIVRLSGGRNIYVLWSGGIDSTVVLAAIRKVADHKKIQVVHSAESVKEYPFLFDAWVDKKLKSVVFENKVSDTEMFYRYKEDGIFCTGDLADQIFGSMLYDKYKDPGVLLKDWRYAWHFTNSGFIDLLEAFVKKCPQDVRTVKEFLWWYNYCVKYQGVCFKMLINSPGIILDKDLFHFFHSKSFNDWSVSTPMEEKFFGSDVKQYKMLAKKYIYKETGDIEYMANKTKLASAGFGKILENTNYKKISTDWKWNK